MNEEWKRIEPTEVHKVGWRTVVTKHFELPDGKVISFDTVGAESANDVAVLALTPENKVVVARLFRPGPEKLMIELPGGIIDAGENAQEAGIRELGEETGFIPSEGSEITDLGTMPQQDAYSNALKHYFMITNVVRRMKQKLETEETITVDTISISKAIDNAKKGRMTDAVAILLAYDRLREIEKET
jgi:ADP-ribose pyrophosphatase